MLSQTIKQSNNQTINQTIKQSNNQTIKQSNNQIDYKARVKISRATSGVTSPFSPSCVIP